MLVGQSGSHQKWRNASNGKQVIVAYHRGRVLAVVSRPAQGQSSADIAVYPANLCPQFVFVPSDVRRAADGSVIA